MDEFDEDFNVKFVKFIKILGIVYHVFKSSDHKIILIYDAFYRPKLYCGRESKTLITVKKRLFPTIMLFRRWRRDTHLEIVETNKIVNVRIT